MTAGTLITTLALGWTIALLLAAWWAWGSVRSWWFSRSGKRAGTRYCRACGFDLTGLTPNNTTPATRCPECGAEIDRPGAVLIGRAVTRRPKLKWTALAVALVTTLVFAALTVSQPPALWMHRMPDWVLVRTAKIGTNADAENALRELSKRWGFVSWMPTPWRVASITGLNYPADALPIGGKQPPNLAAVAELAREALERQSDRSRPWEPVWGQVIESAIALNLLDDQQRARYQENWVTLAMTSRPMIRVGTKLPVSFAVTDVRTPRKVNLFIADEDLVPRSPSPGVSGTSTSYDVNPGNTSLRELSGVARLPIGVHDIEIEADVAASDNEVGRDQAKPRRWKAKVEVVASDQQISQMVSAPTVDEAMRNALGMSWIELWRETPGVAAAAPESSVPIEFVHVRVNVRILNPLPMNLAARIEALDSSQPSDGAVPLGNLTVSPSTVSKLSFVWTVGAEDLPGVLRRRDAQLRLVGDAGVADSSLIVGPFWRGKIEFPKVPVFARNVPGVPDRPLPTSRD